MNRLLHSVHSVHRIVFLLCLIILSGCSGEAYQQGYLQAHQDMAERSGLFRQTLKQSMAFQLTCVSIALSLFAWRGDKLIERIRQGFFSRILRLNIQYQLMILMTGYTIVFISLLTFACYRYGVSYAFPILIVSSSSFYLFIHYVLALAVGDSDRSRLYATKVIQLQSFCAIVILIYEILSDVGFLGLKLVAS